MNWGGESYCAIHIPYREMASEYLELLYDLMGKEWRDEWIDRKYPDDKSFSWQSCYYWAEDLYNKLNLPTGLLLLAP
jgi:hypothetical protein